jgi:hypothetical protein
MSQKQEDKPATTSATPPPDMHADMHGGKNNGTFDGFGVGPIAGLPAKANGVKAPNDAHPGSIAELHQAARNRR